MSSRGNVPGSVREEGPYYDEEEGDSRHTLPDISPANAAALSASGVHIDQNTIDNLHANAEAAGDGTVFANTDSTYHIIPGSVNPDTLAQFAGGGVPGVTVHAHSVWGDDATHTTDAANGVEFVTLGPKDTSGEHSWVMDTVLQPSGMIELHGFDWGETQASKQGALGAIGRVAYTIMANTGIGGFNEGALYTIGDQSSAQALYDAMGYQGINPTYLDFSSENTDDFQNLQAVLDENGVGWPPPGIEE